MHASLQITFRNVDRSDAVENKIRERAVRLERFFGDIVSCRVAVALMHKHHRQGNRFQVRIDLTVPGDELVVSRGPEEHHGYTDVYVAIRDAFDAMERRLEEYVGRLRREVKAHAAPLDGRVTEVYHTDDYGRIETADGRLVYFHRDSVADGEFDHLAVGCEVRFSEGHGERGRQASSVELIVTHNIVG